MIQVPRRFERNPYIRALGMRVYSTAHDTMTVIGGSEPHVVQAIGNHLKCDCRAWHFRRHCAHLQAIEYLYKESQKGNDQVADLVLDKSSKERGKPVNLPRAQTMLYGGLFSGWFLHDSQFGVSVGVKVLVTHIAAGKGWEKLDQITEAMCFVNPKWFYNEKKRQASHLMQVVQALTGVEFDQLEPLNTDDVKKILNENVGTGVLFSASVTTDKNGVERNTITKTKDKISFDMCDSSFGPLATAMSQKIEVKESQNGGRYIAKPEPVYQDSSESVDDRGDLSDEVPF